LPATDAHEEAGLEAIAELELFDAATSTERVLESAGDGWSSFRVGKSRHDQRYENKRAHAVADSKRYAGKRGIGCPVNPRRFVEDRGFATRLS
jgi:hypothetical protein